MTACPSLTLEVTTKCRPAGGRPYCVSVPRSSVPLRRGRGVARVLSSSLWAHVHGLEVNAGSRTRRYSRQKKSNENGPQPAALNARAFHL